MCEKVAARLAGPGLPPQHFASTTALRSKDRPQQLVEAGKVNTARHKLHGPLVGRANHTAPPGASTAHCLRSSQSLPLTIIEGRMPILPMLGLFPLENVLRNAVPRLSRNAEPASGALPIVAVCFHLGRGESPERGVHNPHRSRESVTIMPAHQMSPTGRRNHRPRGMSVSIVAVRTHKPRWATVGHKHIPAIARLEKSPLARTNSLRRLIKIRSIIITSALGRRTRSRPRNISMRCSGRGSRRPCRAPSNGRSGGAPTNSSSLSHSTQGRESRAATQRSSTATQRRSGSPGRRSTAAIGRIANFAS